MDHNNVTPSAQAVRPFGLQVLEGPEPNWREKHGKPTLDVVAVHGLNGDRILSWTHEPQSQNETMWLRDMLPRKLPNARVMTFGYNADIVGNTSSGGIRANARKLLADLRDNRDPEDDEDPTRRLVFVGHSLGGIIIKQALRIANNELPYRQIANSTKGIVFFGTPHRGANTKIWSTLIERIVSYSLGKQAQIHELVAALEANSRDLMEISEDFRPIARKYAIISFYEEDVCSEGAAMVERHSALMELPHEEAVMLGGTHSSICKFSRDDQRFGSVWKRIKRAGNGPEYL